MLAGAPAVFGAALAGAGGVGQFGLVAENDSFLHGSDKWYTNGARLSYAAEPLPPGSAWRGRLDGLADALWFTGAGTIAPGYGFFLGQSIFTPDDLNRRQPDPRDRPYAGWLYGGASLDRDDGRMLDRAEVTIGLVGPNSGAAWMQRHFHELTVGWLRGTDPAGWDAQLDNEPGLILSRERIWRLPLLTTRPGGLQVEVLPQVGASLGNIFTYANAGGVLRIGQGLAADWGPPRIRPGLTGSDRIDPAGFGPARFAWYLFAGAEARLVGRNIFLDGNSFQDSPSVDRKPVVSDFTAGLAVLLRGARASVSYIRRSKEFKTQPRPEEFLSIALTVRF